MKPFDPESETAVEYVARLEAKIVYLRALLMASRNYVDRDHHGMLAEIDAALACS